MTNHHIGLTHVAQTADGYTYMHSTFIMSSTLYITYAACRADRGCQDSRDLEPFVLDPFSTWILHRDGTSCLQGFTVNSENIDK